MTELFLMDFLPASKSLEKRGQSERIEIREHENGCCHLVKMYNKNTLRAENMRPVVLRKFIEWRQTMPLSDRTALDGFAGSLRHTVLDDGGRLVGVALPIAPQRFWYKNKQGENLPRDASKLCSEPGRREEYFAEPFRYAFLGNFLKALLWLHNHGAAQGDISLQNVLVGNDSNCYLLDMDSAWLGRDSAFGAIQNDRYAVAFKHTGFTPRTDLGKFAIVAAKVLSKQSNLKDLAAVQDIMAMRHYRLLTRMWKGEPVNPQVVREMADAWIGCSEREFGFTFSSTSIRRIAYRGDASVIAKADAVTSDLCADLFTMPPRWQTLSYADTRRSTEPVKPELMSGTSVSAKTGAGTPAPPSPQAIKQPIKLTRRDYSWAWRLVVVLVIAAVVWWFFLR